MRASIRLRLKKQVAPGDTGSADQQTMNSLFGRCLAT
jgi:hypothetical protein